VVTDNDNSSVRPITANIDNTRYRFICPRYNIALVTYLQFHRINNEIFKRKQVDLFYRSNVDHER
ncbi:MAG: hypothetical protein WB815_12610, partial [Nitrososphaeraceae archaeon]